KLSETLPMGRVWKLSETLPMGRVWKLSETLPMGRVWKLSETLSYGARLETQRNAFLWGAFQVLIESLSNPKITS
ncbi:hypothetical protein, partial [Leptospira santarosai]